MLTSESVRQRGAGRAVGALRPGIVRANIALQIVLALASAVLAMLLLHRHYLRFDATSRGVFTLSEETLALLRAVERSDRRVVATACFRMPGGPQADQEEWLQKRVSDMLREYDARAAGFDFRLIRIDAEVEKFERFVTALGWRPPDSSIVFQCSGRSRAVGTEEMFERTRQEVGTRTPVIQLRFKGEQVLTAALKWVVSERRRTVYFTTGHGERDPADTDEDLGYSTARARLEGDSYAVRKVGLAESRRVPDDAAALVIAGPRAPFEEEELLVVRQYLERGGGLMALLEPRQADGRSEGLAGLLAEHGIRVRDDVFACQAIVWGGFNELPHPLTRGVLGYRSGYYVPCALETGDSASAPRQDAAGYVSTQIVLAPREIWGETSPVEPRTYDPMYDLPGPLTLVAASERMRAIPAQGRPRFEPAGGARIVVVADSDCFGNALLGGGRSPGNDKLLVNAIAWLDQDALPPVLVPAQTLDYRPLSNWSGRAERTVLLVSLGLLPALSLAAGAALWFVRRRG